MAFILFHFSEGMRNSKLFRRIGIAVVIGVILIAAACKKSTNTRRIAQKWHVQKYIVGMKDSTDYFDSVFMSYQIEFNKNGGYTEIYYTPANVKKQISGTWLFLDKYETLQMKDTLTRSFRILRLTKDNLDLLDSLNCEMEMVPF